MPSDPVVAGSVEDSGSDGDSELGRGKLPVRVLGMVMMSGWMRRIMCWTEMRGEVSVETQAREQARILTCDSGSMAVCEFLLASGEEGP